MTKRRLGVRLVIPSGVLMLPPFSGNSPEGEEMAWIYSSEVRARPWSTRLHREPAAPRVRRHLLWSLSLASMLSVLSSSCYDLPTYNIVYCSMDAGDSFDMTNASRTARFEFAAVWFWSQGHFYTRVGIKVRNVSANHLHIPVKSIRFRSKRYNYELEQLFYLRKRETITPQDEEAVIVPRGESIEIRIHLEAATGSSDAVAGPIAADEELVIQVDDMTLGDRRIEPLAVTFVPRTR